MSDYQTERLERIEKILKTANDVYSPAIAAQAGIQLARVEVPWLITTIEYLTARLTAETSDVSNVLNLEEYRARGQEPAQALAV